jgi:hypothetical protein
MNNKLIEHQINWITKLEYFSVKLPHEQKLPCRIAKVFRIPIRLVAWIRIQKDWKEEKKRSQK